MPFSSPGDLPDPGIEPRSPALLAGALPSEPPAVQEPNSLRGQGDPCGLESGKLEKSVSLDSALEGWVGFH